VVLAVQVAVVFLLAALVIHHQLAHHKVMRVEITVLAHIQMVMRQVVVVEQVLLALTVLA
jgi:hypothetical protein